VAAVGGLDKGEKKAGLELGRQLGVKKNPKEKLALLFYDSIKCPPPPAPVLNRMFPFAAMRLMRCKSLRLNAFSGCRSAFF
jgi:hypothetical protein